MPSDKKIIEQSLIAYLDCHLSLEAKYKLKENDLEWVAGEIVSICLRWIFTDRNLLDKIEKKSQHQDDFDFIRELKSL